MADNPFKNLRMQAGDQQRSVNWYQTQVRQLRGLNTQMDRLVKNSPELTNKIMPGRLYLFSYDPKHKDTLPFYDTLPLVLPFKTVKGGFLGINLHYLPYMIRFKLMGALLDLVSDIEDPNSRALASWRLLNSSSRYRGVEVSVKHYLTAQVQSRFLQIPPDQWIAASQLPIERFEGQSKDVVWRDSRRRLS
jgi:hypothetical protein